MITESSLQPASATTSSSSTIDPALDRLDLVGIVDRWGTPTYVYDAAVLTDTLGALRMALHPAVEIFYSLKANPNGAVYAVLRSGGVRAEVCSLAELQTVLDLGTPGEDILFLGPGKSPDELAASLDAGVLVVAESWGELGQLEAMAASRGGRVSVALRVNPALEGKGSGLSMGGKPRQFGIDEAALIGPAVTNTLGNMFPHLEVVGIQAYMGTRILDASLIAANTAHIIELASRIAHQHQLDLRLIDVGGGLGVPYFDNEDMLDLDELATLMNPMIAGLVATAPQCRVALETGRYLTALAGTYLTRVRYVKESRGERFAVCDGGTNHHMAAVGIGSFVKRNFPIELVGSKENAPRAPWNISGPLCTPNDLLAKHIALPDLRPGDLLAVRRSGAYGLTASPGLFLSHGFPAEVMVIDNTAYMVRRRDTVADLRRNQLLPEALRAPVSTGRTERTPHRTRRAVP